MAIDYQQLQYKAFFIQALWQKNRKHMLQFYNLI